MAFADAAADLVRAWLDAPRHINIQDASRSFTTAFDQIYDLHLPGFLPNPPSGQMIDAMFAVGPGEFSFLFERKVYFHADNTIVPSLILRETFQLFRCPIDPRNSTAFREIMRWAPLIS